MQGERDVSGGCDRDTAINDKAIWAPEGLESGGSSRYDSIAAIAVVLQHAHVHLLLRISMKKTQRNEN